MGKMVWLKDREPWWQRVAERLRTWWLYRHFRSSMVVTRHGRAGTYHGGRIKGSAVGEGTEDWHRTTELYLPGKGMIEKLDTRNEGQ